MTQMNLSNLISRAITTGNNPGKASGNSKRSGADRLADRSSEVSENKEFKDESLARGDSRESSDTSRESSRSSKSDKSRKADNKPVGKAQQGKENEQAEVVDFQALVSNLITPAELQGEAGSGNEKISEEIVATAAIESVSASELGFASKHPMMGNQFMTPAAAGLKQSIEVNQAITQEIEAIINKAGIEVAGQAETQITALNAGEMLANAEGIEVPAAAQGEIPVAGGERIAPENHGQAVKAAVEEALAGKSDQPAGEIGEAVKEVAQQAGQTNETQQVAPQLAEGKVEISGFEQTTEQVAAQPVTTEQVAASQNDMEAKPVLGPMIEQAAETNKPATDATTLEEATEEVKTPEVEVVDSNEAKPAATTPRNNIAAMNARRGNEVSATTAASAAAGEDVDLSELEIKADAGDKKSQAKPISGIEARAAANPTPAEAALSNASDTSAVSEISQIRQAVPTENIAAMMNDRISVIDQVAEQISISRDQLDTDITLQLNPAELGSVKIQLSMNSGELKGVIEVDNSRTLAEMNREAPALIEKLGEAGVTVKELEFQMNDPDQGRSDENSAQDLFEQFANSNSNGSQADGSRNQQQANNQGGSRGNDREYRQGESDLSDDRGVATDGSVDVML